MNVEDMDEMLIRNWNSRVLPDDDVWILGDFCYKPQVSPTVYLRRLKGHKHLILGNHDGLILKDPEALSCLESVEKMDHIKDGDKQIVMCHFPLAEWNKSMHGSILVYGHIHANIGETYDYMTRRYPNQAYNAGCMINNYQPVSFKELVKNNLYFRQQTDKAKIEE